jgi:quercetin dioxygenase-like cupin family protein
MFIVKSKDAALEQFKFHSMLTGIVNESDNVEVVMGTAVFKPDARVPDEGFGVHKFDEYSYIIEGEIEAQIEDKKVMIKAGEFSFIGKGEQHWSMNNSDTDCKLIWISVTKKE